MDPARLVAGTQENPTPDAKKAKKLKDRPRRFPQHNKDYKAFRLRLKEARDMAGLSQQELADLLKRPQTWISKNETGERRVDAVELAKLARALKRPMEWFVEGVQ